MGPDAASEWTLSKNNIEKIVGTVDVFPFPVWYNCAHEDRYANDYSALMLTSTRKG